MTNDLISREAVLEILMKYCPDDDGSCSKADIDLREMLDEIENIPAVDAAPVVHGRWIELEGNAFENDGWQCSACGYKIYSDFVELEELQELGGALYCEHCGAKMDGDS